MAPTPVQRQISPIAIAANTINGLLTSANSGTDVPKITPSPHTIAQTIPAALGARGGVFDSAVVDAAADPHCLQ
jgi:hypothetical protein